MDWFKLSYTVLGGLGLFFFGMRLLSESLQSIAGDFIRNIINSLTTHRMIAVGVGLVVTAIVQSSSITTVMAVGFVNAGLMNLTQAIGVIFGANIGTTITGWIISIKIGKYSLLLIGLGFLPFLFMKDGRIKSWGKVIFSLGLVFIGLKTMSGAFKPLRSNEDFLMLMQFFSATSYWSVIATAFIGCILTFIIQSSSAMLGITIALASTGAISFHTALALVLGENIGTTITALLAGIGTNIHARRAALAHATFNILGVIVITSIFSFYVEFIENLVAGPADLINGKGEKPNIATHIATGHTIFNVANVLIFLPFLHYLAKLVTWIIPEKTTEKVPKHLEMVGPADTISPIIAIEQTRLELLKMSDMVRTMLENTWSYFHSAGKRDEYIDKVVKYERITDNIQAEVTVFLSQVMASPMTQEESTEVKSLLRIADELESIADYCESIVNYSKGGFKNDIRFDDETMGELDNLAQRATTLFHLAETFLKDKNSDTSDFWKQVKEFSFEADQVKDHYLERIQQSNYPPLAALTISDIAVAIRRIKNHTVNLVEAITHSSPQRKV